METHIPGKTIELKKRANTPNSYARGARRWAFGLLLAGAAVSGCTPQETPQIRAEATPQPDLHTILMNSPLVEDSQILVNQSNFMSPIMFRDNGYIPAQPGQAIIAGRPIYYWSPVTIRGFDKEYQKEVAERGQDSLVYGDNQPGQRCNIVDRSTIEPISSISEQDGGTLVRLDSPGFTNAGIAGISEAQPFVNACRAGTQFEVYLNNR